MDLILCENVGAVRVLTLNRPEKHNALNTALTQALIDALRAADIEQEVRAVILTGAGKSFCSGADMSELTGVTEDAISIRRRGALLTTLHSVCGQISKPIVAAVRGNAIGGGAGLAIDCDLVVMAEDTRFGYPELKHGIVGGVVMANLVRQVGRKQAFELLSLGEPISGLRAHAIGLANRVVPHDLVLESALDLAHTLAGWSPLAMSMTKRTFQRACELRLDEALEVGGDVSTMMRGFRQATKTN